MPARVSRIGFRRRRVLGLAYSDRYIAAPEAEGRRDQHRDHRHLDRADEERRDVELAAAAATSRSRPERDRDRPGEEARSLGRPARRTIATLIDERDARSDGQERHGRRLPCADAVDCPADARSRAPDHPSSWPWCGYLTRRSRAGKGRTAVAVRPIRPRCDPIRPPPTPRRSGWPRSDRREARCSRPPSTRPSSAPRPHVEVDVGRDLGPRQRLGAHVDVQRARQRVGAVGDRLGRSARRIRRRRRSGSP